MDVLEIDGKQFVKASALARELGYTADYIGQLCRGKKITAQLVGRSWYVDKDSLRAHKTVKQRSSKAKTRDALQVELRKLSVNFDEKKVKNENSSRKTTQNSAHFYSKIKPTYTSYLDDDSELIPVLQIKPDKTLKTLDVEPAEATKINIDSQSKRYSLSATKLPKIRFSGSLDVSEAEEKEMKETSEEREIANPIHVALEKSQEKPLQQVKKADSDGSKSAKSQKVSKKRSRGTVAMKRTASLVAESETVHVAVENVDYRQPISRRYALFFISSVILLAAVVSVTLIALETSTTVVAASGQTDFMYDFNLSTALRSLGY